MSDYDKEILREYEIEVWDRFKKAVDECLRLEFSEKQLIAHVNIKYCQVKGERA